MAMMGRPGGFSALNTLRRDQSVKDVKIAPGTVKRILGFVRPYRVILVWFLTLVVIDAVIGVANPLIYREIIRAIQAHNPSIIVWLAGLVALLAVLDGGLSLLQRYVSGRVGEGLIFDMRTQVFAHVQRMGMPFFMRTQTGALVSRLNTDVQGAQEAFTDVLSTVVGNLISVTLVLITMFVLSWQLTLVALVLLPLFALPARWLGQRIQAITREGYDLSASMNTTMVERFNVAGALLVKLFGRADQEDREFSDKAARVRDIAITRGMYARIFFVSLMLTASLAVALVYGWGGTMAVQGLLDIGTLVALTAYLNRLYGPLTSLSNIHVDIMTMLVSFERVFEVLDLPATVTEKPDAVAIPRGPALVEFDHVAFSYPKAESASLESLGSIMTPDAGNEHEVLRDVTFTARPGEVIALVGPSGAGKTTMSYLVPRLYDATDGAVRINGVDVRDATFDSLHAVVGMVTQDPHMFHDSIRANLLYADPAATDAQIHDALEGAQILSLVDSLPDGLDTIVGDRGYRLSGGEKQRLALARLLLKAPDVVVLDEATAHLDSESEVAVQAALKTALAGRTSIVIAHRLSTVRDADRILVIVEGRIAESGRHDELITLGGVYADLYETQFRTHAGASPAVATA